MVPLDRTSSSKGSGVRCRGSIGHVAAGDGCLWAVLRRNPPLACPNKHPTFWTASERYQDQKINESNSDLRLQESCSKITQCFYARLSMITKAILLALSPLTSSKSYCLSILLQLGDQCIPLLNDICILFVLVVWSCRLNDAIDAVDGTWYAVGGNELG